MESPDTRESKQGTSMKFLPIGSEDKRAGGGRLLALAACCIIGFSFAGRFPTEH
jgi:hypothetical protein